VLRGAQLACKNRPVPTESLEALADTVQRHVYQRGEETISSRIIGQFVERELKQLDQVAYLRFASVHESFETPEAFAKAITSL
jgi:transcriptional repressor NrdR